MSKFIPKGPKRFTHQTAALKKIITTRGKTALVMDPGTGKTAPTLDYLSILALKNPAPVRALVLAPKVALDNWVEQSSKYVHDDVTLWAEALGGTIENRAKTITHRTDSSLSMRSVGVRKSIALYARTDKGKPVRKPGDFTGRNRLTMLCLALDSLSTKRAVTPKGSVTTTDRIVKAISKFQPDVIVVDESHRIKTPSSNVGRAMSRLASLTTRRILLTGTLMPNSPLDVWGQWRFLDSSVFGTYSSFEDRYAVFGGYMGKEVKAYKNLDDLQHKMRRNAIVVRKQDALDLPAVTSTTVRVDLSPRETRAYNEMKSSLVTQLESGDLAKAPNRLSQMMRLRQITSGFLRDNDDGIEQVGTSKINAVRGLIQETLAGEKRIVVFANFRDEIKALKETLKTRGTTVLSITGDTKDADRIAIRKRFGSDAPERIVLIAQIRTMSLSVNELVTASHAIYTSLSERRDDWIQSRDRLHRIGQRLPVTFWNMVATVNGKSTVDYVMLSSHQDKTDLEASLIDHLKHN